ncbi:hypothetical protein ACTXIV_08590 [Psychrobacter celer]|uniref:hypothetical protein n=1 Tax=Psychrobacter celer TaxID=306572 RepID=UPI003FD676BB
MNSEKRTALIAAITAAASSKMNPISIVAEDNYANFKPMLNDDGTYSIFAAVEIKTAFEPVPDFKYNFADISFEVQFEQCTYNADSKQYEQTIDETSYHINYGDLENNIMFGYSDSTDLESCVWADEGVNDISDAEDNSMSVEILRSLFNTADNEVEIITAIFNKVSKTTDAPDAA